VYNCKWVKLSSCTSK